MAMWITSLSLFYLINIGPEVETRYSPTEAVATQKQTEWSLWYSGSSQIKNVRSRVISKQSRVLRRSPRSKPRMNCGYKPAYWAGIMRKYAKNKKELNWLWEVARCESGFDTCSYNVSSGASGLFQWIPKWWDKQYSEDIWDGEAQIKHTLEKYRAGGKGLWNASKHCWNK